MFDKLFKRLHLDINSDSEWEGGTPEFPRFMVLETLWNIPLSKLSLFVIEKVIYSRLTSKDGQKEKKRRKMKYFGRSGKKNKQRHW